MCIRDRTANTLYGENNFVKAYKWERLVGSYHGSGCTLTSAIAACMAHGLTLEEAVLEAQEFTWQTLKNGFRPGMGQYIPDRLFWARDEEEDVYKRQGHDFPNLTLVGVIDADSALHSPDFRASERLFAQLMQVAGRAGRADKTGQVIIQTQFPEHVLFNVLRRQDYASYANALLHERQQMQFPPYIFMALLRAEANDFNLVHQFLSYAFKVACGKSNSIIASIISSLLKSSPRPEVKMGSINKGTSG